MTHLRDNLLLVALGILSAIAQLVAMRWGLAGDLVGGLLCGGIILMGARILALEIEHIYLPSLVAAAGSLLGFAFGMAGSVTVYPPIAWASPLLAALLPGVPALYTTMRGAKCQLCHTTLRRLLSFSCPRCHLVTCENCWQFERDRCRLCEANQIALFPLDLSWWQEHLGSQVQGGRCTLCLRTVDGRVAHWACAACGHGQCRLCWDDNNGQCSRCEWTIPDLPAEVSAYIAIGARAKTNI